MRCTRKGFDVLELSNGMFVNMKLIICARWEAEIIDGTRVIRYRLDFLQSPASLVVWLVDEADVKLVQGWMKNASH